MKRSIRLQNYSVADRSLAFFAFSKWRRQSRNQSASFQVIVPLFSDKAYYFLPPIRVHILSKLYSNTDCDSLLFYFTENCHRMLLDIYLIICLSILQTCIPCKWKHEAYCAANPVWFHWKTRNWEMSIYLQLQKHVIKIYDVNQYSSQSRLYPLGSWARGTTIKWD